MANAGTLVEVFDNACFEYAEKPAFSAVGHTLSFDQLEALSRDFAAWLQNETDLEPGDRIAIQLPNLLQYPVVAFGALRAGLVIVNTNPLYTDRELEHQLKDSGARAMVVLENFAVHAANVIRHTQVKHVITTQIADLHPFLRRHLINAVVKYVKKAVPEFSFQHHYQLPEVLHAGEQLEFLPISQSSEDIAVLQYTGGTTGVAKGAMLSHFNLVSNMRQVLSHIPEVFETCQHTYCAPLPLYHIYAFNLHLLCSLSSGNHSVLVPNPRDLSSITKVFNRYNITGLMSLNTLYNALLHDEDFADAHLEDLKYCSAGGMAMMADTTNRWRELTGCEILEGYGLTETSPVVSINPVGKVRPGTIGTPLPDTEVKVIDDQGRNLPTGEPGELCVRGPQVMVGYWQRPEETAKAISMDGWFATGDVAVIDEDGYLRIVDRIKDMIDVSGFKVYPNEVEDVVTSHPDIVECAVIGIPSDETGEAVKIFAVKKAEVTEEEILAFCHERLTGYKVPKHIDFVTELPKSNVGKVLRRELREMALAG
jgi:long-chain acyl-CoA synthetase